MAWTFIAQLVLGLVLSAISYALSPRPKTEKPQAAGLDDFSLPTAEEGRPISFPLHCLKLVLRTPFHWQRLEQPRQCDLRPLFPI